MSKLDSVEIENCSAEENVAIAAAASQVAVAFRAAIRELERLDNDNAVDGLYEIVARMVEDSPTDYLPDGYAVSA